MNKSYYIEKTFNMISDNDRFLNILRKHGLLLSSEMIADSAANNVKDILMLELTYQNREMGRFLATYLYNNDEVIKNNDIDWLISNNILKSDVQNYFGASVEEEVFREMFYCYKFCKESSFYQNNMFRFLPEYDYNKLTENEILDGYFDFVNKYFDKINDFINNIGEFYEVDKINYKYINYYSQLFGIDDSKFYIDNENRHRLFLKNILGIYRQNGTINSIKMIMDFFDVEFKVKEFFFDRRMFYKNNYVIETGAVYIERINEETYTSNTFNHEFYLTENNPVDNKLTVSVNETVTLKDISEQYSLLDFNDLARLWGPEAVLGYSRWGTVVNENLNTEYTGNVYKYFKSDKIQFDIYTEDGTIANDRLAYINKLLDFCLPSNLMRKINIMRKPSVTPL